MMKNLAMTEQTNTMLPKHLDKTKILKFDNILFSNFKLKDRNNTHKFSFWCR